MYIRLQRNQAGFTLLELSIVLVVIALIAGGIMAGAGLKHSAELKSISQDVANISSAVSIFKKRFDALPGDMLDATSQWGTSSNCNVASTGSETCNGDGNGSVSTPGTTSTYQEAYRFWQHLANAKLWDGQFSGHYTGNVICLSSRHCGNTRYPGGAFYATTLNDNTTYFGSAVPFTTTQPDRGNVLVLSKLLSGTTGLVGAPLLTTEDAFSLDQKFDDGRPAYGFIQSFIPAASAGVQTNSCANSTTAAGATYLTSSTGIQCSLMFTKIF